jgi:AraC-like DNA-binding protein
MARSLAAAPAGPALWVGMPIIRNAVLSVAGNSKVIAEMCAAIGIEPEDLEDADRRLTLEQCIITIQQALHISGDPHLALHLGERTRVSALGLAGLIMESSKDAFTVLQCAQEFSQAFTNVQSFRLEAEGTMVHFLSEMAPVWVERSPETAHYVIETTFSSVVHQLYLLTRKHLRPMRVLFRQDRPADTREHERVFGCRPEFGQELNCMIFSAYDLRTPVVGHNRTLSNVLKGVYEEHVRRHVDGSFTEKVKQVVLGNLRVTFPPLEVIAEALHVTPRTLQRKLHQEGTTYRALSDAVKQELAEHLLANPVLAISDIAYKLGYAEPTSFQRAFRQWTGSTPMEFRKRKLNA